MLGWWSGNSPVVRTQASAPRRARKQLRTSKHGVHEVVGGGHDRTAVVVRLDVRVPPRRDGPTQDVRGHRNACNAHLYGV